MIIWHRDIQELYREYLGLYKGIGEENGRYYLGFWVWGYYPKNWRIKMENTMEHEVKMIRGFQNF